MINISRGCWCGGPTGFDFQTYIGDSSCMITVREPYDSEDENVVYRWNLHIRGQLYDYYMNEKTSCLNFSSAKLDYEPIINVEPYINCIYDLWISGRLL